MTDAVVRPEWRCSPALAVEADVCSMVRALAGVEDISSTAARAYAYVAAGISTEAATEHDREAVRRGKIFRSRIQVVGS